MDVSAEILKRVDLLAAKLGVASEFIWKTLVVQARVEGVSSLLTAGVLVGLMTGGLVIAGKCFGKAKKECKDDPWNSGFAGGAIFFWLVAFILLCFAIGNVFAAITPLMNPEYWALQKVLETLK